LKRGRVNGLYSNGNIPAYFDQQKQLLSGLLSLSVLEHWIVKAQSRATY